MNSKREKVATSFIFFLAQGKLTLWSVVRSDRILNLSKLLCMSSLPASMKRIWWRTATEKWQHSFSHYKAMGIFSDAQGQLTPKTVVGSDRISNSSELLCMSSLPASMKRIAWKTVEKKWQNRFYHYNPICCHGNQGSDLAEFRTHLSSHVWHQYLQVWKGSNQEQLRKSGNTVFPLFFHGDFFQALKGS